MATAGNSSKIIYGEFDFSSNLASASVSHAVQTVDVTTFGSSNVVLLPTLESGEVSFDGFWAGDTDGIDEEIVARLQSSSNTPVTFAMAGLTRGNKVKMISSKQTNYEISSEVAGAVGLSASMNGEFVGGGVSLKDLDAESASTDHTSVDNSASTSNGAIAYIHVTAVTGTPSAVIKVQHSADDSSWADLATFTTVTAATSEIKSVTGTVNQYLRVSSTFGGSGSVTYSLVLARKLK